MNTKRIALLIAASVSTVAFAQSTEGFFKPEPIQLAEGKISAPSAVDPNPHVYACQVVIDWDPARPDLIALRYPKGSDHCIGTGIRATVTALDLMVELFPHKRAPAQ